MMFQSVLSPKAALNRFGVEYALQQVNQTVLQHLHPEHVEVEIWRADELEVRQGRGSELDELWSSVRSKTNPR